MPGEFNYCPRCGHELAEKSIEDRPRPYCPSCDYVVFMDPKLAVVVLISVDAKLVMVRRANEPALGRWSFPSGYVDRGEPVEEAGKREVMEETGLDVRMKELVGLYSARDQTVVLAAYSADVVGGSLQPGHEVHEAALFSVDELPPLPFPHDYQILGDWRLLASSKERC